MPLHPYPCKQTKLIVYIITWQQVKTLPFYFILRLVELNLVKSIPKNRFNSIIMNEQITKPQAPPPNYLVFAILVTIFCCQILGIVSIVFAAQVNSKWNAGDYDGALNSSKNAKLWAWIGFASGFAVILIVMLLSFFGIIAGLSLGDWDF